MGRCRGLDQIIILELMAHIVIVHQHLALPGVVGAVRPLLGLGIVAAGLELGRAVGLIPAGRGLGPDRRGGLAVLGSAGRCGDGVIGECVVQIHVDTPM